MPPSTLNRIRILLTCYSRPESFPLSTASSNTGITLSDIQCDRFTQIAAATWLPTTTTVSATTRQFNPSLVVEIYRTELTVKSGKKTVPLQRVMMLEVSQYLENYFWPNFDPKTATFEHVMSMILMINKKV
ncbi:hypothetical protein RND81_12G081900 [Saponaria officinalis]|uniref:RNA helicase aquarius N-terminal domain-containing protein n=1 Tax=Saponaria officinalis TaxID=3572 RepID=A0AAW1H811_SAPOF